MNKKFLATGMVATGIAATALLTPAVVFAQANTTEVSNFVAKLSAQLGIDQSKVQSALDTVRTEMHQEREAEMKTNIATAVTEGKLTQRQADLILATMQIRSELMASGEKPTPPQFDSSLTEEQRRAQMETFRTEREQEMVTKLNEKGLNTNLEELQAAQTAMRVAGIQSKGPDGGRGGRGMGRMV